MIDIKVRAVLRTKESTSGQVILEPGPNGDVVLEVIRHQRCLFDHAHDESCRQTQVVTTRVGLDDLSRALSAIRFAVDAKASDHGNR